MDALDSKIGKQDDLVLKRDVRKKNDEARRRVFSEALDRRLYEVSLYPTDDIHEIIRHPDVCLNLSVDVADLGSDVKKQLFETCLNLIQFPSSSDPEGLHKFAKITVPGAPDCFMQIDLHENGLRIVTLATFDEY